VHSLINNYFDYLFSDLTIYSNSPKSVTMIFLPAFYFLLRSLNPAETSHFNKILWRENTLIFENHKKVNEEKQEIPVSIIGEN
jgi:hypothetical protein